MADTPAVPWTHRLFARSDLPARVAPFHLGVSALAVALLGLAAAAASTRAPWPVSLLAEPARPPLVAWGGAAVFALLFFAMQKQGFVFRWRQQSTKISLDEVALFLGALALPPAHLVLGIGASSLVNQVTHRRDWAKASFNVAQYVVAGALAAFVVLAMRLAGFASPWPAATAPVVFAFGTSILVSLLFHAMGEGPTFTIYRERFGSWALVGAALGVSLGLVVYALYLVHPFAVAAAVPLFFYLRRFGRLSEWADDELKTHKLLAAVSVQLAGRSDLDTVARQVLTAVNELLDCGEAQLSLGTGDGREPRFWRTTFGEGASGAGGVTAAVQDAHGKRLGELTVFPKHGQRHYGEREHHLLRTVAANAAAAAANARALHQLMEANRQLVQSERRYRSLFETANVFIHVLDGDGRVADMNPAAFIALGYPAREILGKPLCDLVAPASRADAGDLFEMLRRDGELRGVEARLLARDGREIVVLLDAQMLDEGEGRARYVVSSRDITSLKSLEDELRGSMESQRDTIRRLENMNRELEEFTLWTTHDMREPLRSIGTIASFLYEDLGNIPYNEARDMARRVHEGAERLKERVKALHAFSRIVQRDDAFEDVDLQEVVEDVLLSLEAKVEERAARVRILTALPIVRAQPHRIHQVFANLVENALKYGRAEHGTIEVGHIETPDEWRLFVRDDGPGVPAGYQDRIFQLFQRGPEAAREPGSGAGLAIVKRIAEQHGGRAWVESEQGKGASFWIALPRAEAAARLSASVTLRP